MYSTTPQEEPVRTGRAQAPFGALSGLKVLFKKSLTMSTRRSASSRKGTWPKGSCPRGRSRATRQTSVIRSRLTTHAHLSSSSRFMHALFSWPIPGGNGTVHEAGTHLVADLHAPGQVFPEERERFGGQNPLMRAPNQHGRRLQPAQLRSRQHVRGRRRGEDGVHGRLRNPVEAGPLEPRIARINPSNHAMLS